MPRNPSHRNALKQQNISFDERDEMMKNKKNDKNGLQKNKIFGENDMSLHNSIEMMSHGSAYENRHGRPLCYDSVESLESEIFTFVKYCDKNKIVPTRPALALWLGVTSGTLKRWKDDVTNPFAETIKKTEELFHQFILEKTMQGSINTLLYFFLGKNWFEMQDKTEIVHKSSQTVIDLDEQERIINSTPGIVIDAEYRPVEKQTKEIGVIDTPSVKLSQNAKNEPFEDFETSTAVDLEDLLGEEAVDLDPPVDLQTQEGLGAIEDLPTHADLGAYTQDDTDWDEDL